MNNTQRSEAMEKINNGKSAYVIGTHALIQEDVDFRRWVCGNR